MSPQQMQEMMKKWMEAATPGKHHEALGRYLGQWDTETTIFGMGPQPMKSKGEAEIRWLMPGRWVVTETKGLMMGKPMHGFGIHGYDNFQKKYVAMWVDSMNTQLLTMSGHRSPDGTIETMYGRMDEPATGEVGKWVKYVTRMVNDDRLVLEIHDLGIVGRDTKVVEIVHTRKPS
ncbi:MAG: DUF1579 family protein [Planctomycetota bacterium]|jgi:hypothetical protein